MVNLLDLHDVRVEEQDLSSDDLLIEADTGESLEIIGRGVSGANADDIILESVDEETMLSYPHENPNGEVFPEEALQETGMDILGAMRDMGLSAPTLKVPEGDSYQLVNDSSSAGTATVYYRQGRAQDVSPNDPGHPNNKERTFITSSETTESISSSNTVTFDLDNSNQPGILRDWPWEEEVPPSREYDLQAIMFNLDGDSGGNISLDGFRLQSEEREFLAKSSAIVGKNQAQYPNNSLTRVPFMFPEQPTFSPGDNLDVQAEATISAAGPQDAVVDATLIAYRRDV